MIQSKVNELYVNLAQELQTECHLRQTPELEHLLREYLLRAYVAGFDVGVKVGENGDKK